MKRIIWGLVAVVLMQGCAAFWAWLEPGSMKPGAYARASEQIQRMKVGVTTEDEFIVVWYGDTPEEIRKTTWQVTTGELIGPQTSPTVLDGAGYHKATYFIVRRPDLAAYTPMQYLWAVTFVNGVLESIYTY